METKNKPNEVRTARQFLKDKGIHPTEPIYWDLATTTISLDELMEEYALQQVEQAVSLALRTICENLDLTIGKMDKTLCTQTANIR